MHAPEAYLGARCRRPSPRADTRQHRFWTSRRTVGIDHACVIGKSHLRSGAVFALVPGRRVPRPRCGGQLMRLSLAMLLLCIATIAQASPAGEESQNGPPAARDRSAPDFLFGRPQTEVGVRGSWVFARAGSDWYDFVSDRLTLSRGDFNMPAIAADVGVTMTSRLQAVFGVEFGQATTGSEYR